MNDLPNSREGVLVDGAPNNTIGGPTVAARNLISANHWGVVISAPTATGNLVQGNFIGTDITGTAPPGYGNELDGLLIRLGASGNLIGGPGTEAGNVIAFNERDGVRIEDNSVRNAIVTNRIFSNAGLGINLFVPNDPPSGVTPNDPYDIDSGPNDLQNVPYLTAVATSIDFTNVQGFLVSTPNTTFTVQFFANATLDPSGSGEGERYLGEATVTTNSFGLAIFSANVPGTVSTGQYVTATATDPAGNTSEFSPGITEVLGTVQFQMVDFQVAEGGGVATIVVTRAGGSGGYFTVNYATAGGTATPNVDYLPTSGSLTFAPGVNTQTFTVAILNDTLPEASETVGLVLSDPVGAATLGVPNPALLTIQDDDQPGALRFNMANYTINEQAGAAYITVVRDSGGGAVTVAYATQDGTAQAGVDYVATSGTLVFDPGETSMTFAVPILGGVPNEGDETVILTLGNPTGGATLGMPSSAVLTIQNVDGPRVLDVRAIPGWRGISTIVLTFSEPLDPVRPRTFSTTVTA